MWADDADQLLRSEAEALLAMDCLPQFTINGLTCSKYCSALAEDVDLASMRRSLGLVSVKTTSARVDGVKTNGPEGERLMRRDV